MEQFLSGLLENSSLPFVTALCLGLLTAFSPCPLATNITAIGYISKDVSDRRKVFFNGLIYTAGRAIAYFSLAVLLRFSSEAIHISSWLQIKGEKILGPLLVLFGIFMLDIISPVLPGRGRLSDMINTFAAKGRRGPLLMGILFALAFCPYSGVLYFGMLVPLCIQNTAGVFLALVYAFATGLPVILISWLLAYTVSGIGIWYKRIKIFELWFRRVIAVVFIGTGIWLIFNSWQLFD